MRTSHFLGVFVNGDVSDTCQVDFFNGPQTQSEKRILSFVKECSKRLIAQEKLAQKTGFLRSFDNRQH